MITIDRHLILTIATLIGLVALAMAFASVVTFRPSASAIFLIIGGELIIYFLVTMAMNPRATIGMAALTAVLYAFVRGLCSWIGGILFQITTGAEVLNLVTPWVGNPIPMLLQAFMLVGAGPYILALYIPELVGRREAAKLLGEERRPPGPEPTALTTSPTGGFIQVFSFEELSGVVKKSHGLEGFIIYSNEGLVVWRDLPMRLDVDTVVAKMLAHNTGLGQHMLDCGLTKVRRVMVETREHFIFTTNLNPNFGMMLIFNGRVPTEEILSRIAILAKSTREFLQWKYPSLPLASGSSLERSTLESA